MFFLVWATSLELLPCHGYWADLVNRNLPISVVNICGRRDHKRVLGKVDGNGNNA